LEPRKISLLAQSIQSRIGPLSHAINYNGKHVSDRLVIAELENLLRISKSSFPEHSDYFTSIEAEIRSDGSLPLSKVVEVLDYILELALRNSQIKNPI
jgi:hypothetical protein